MRIDHLPIIILLKKDTKGLSLLLGETVKAEVTNVQPNGYASLRIKGNIIKVRIEIPLDVGQFINLRVMGTRPDGTIEMKFTGFLTVPDKGIAQQGTSGYGLIDTIIEDLEKMILSGSNITKPAEFNKLLLKALRAMPNDTTMVLDTVRSRLEKTLITAIEAKIDSITKRLLDLIKMLPDDIKGKAHNNRLSGHNIKTLLMATEELQVDKLKNLLENTGTLLETRLKWIVENNKIEEAVDILDKDLKANLLRLTKDSLFKTGAETLIRDIETYQVLSKVTDSVYTFLPLIWKELRDGEVSFKRRKDRDGVPSYSCRISLDLKRYGRVAIMIVLHDKSLFVSFVAGDSGFRKILEEKEEMLQKAFIERGLNLKTINVILPKNESTWSYILDAVDIKA